MSKRLAILGVWALLLSLNSGCCLSNCICCWHDRCLAHYQATHFSDCGCGEVFYNNWYNSPPQCCDPCDCYGNWTGRKWWVGNCQGCRGNGCCGPGTCPGVSPAGRTYGPGDGPMMGGPTYDDGGPMMGETISPSEEVPPPYQSRRGGPQRSTQPNPVRQQGPSRMSRQPHYTRPPEPRVTTRTRPQRPEAGVQPADFQGDGPFFDDGPVTPAGGYRASSSTANFRR